MCQGYLLEFLEQESTGGYGRSGSSRKSPLKFPPQVPPKRVGLQCRIEKGNVETENFYQITKYESPGSSSSETVGGQSFEVFDPQRPEVDVGGATYRVKRVDVTETHVP
jgi:hypothetical protein